MPYKCQKVGQKWIVHKKNSRGQWQVLETSGKHGTLAECNKQVRALYYEESQVHNESVININGIVGIEFTADYFNYQLAMASEDTVRINIESRGGDYPTALQIYNSCREKGKKIITSAQGFVMSAGAVILLAGDEIEAASNSVIMFHMPEVIPQERMNADDMMKKAEQLRAAEDSLCAVVKDRTGWEDDKCRNFLNEGKWLTAEEALDMGLIDKILPFVRKKQDVQNLEIPERIVAFVDNSNKEVDKMALKELCTGLGVQITNEMDDAALSNAVVTMVTDLRSQLKVVNEELEATKKLVPPKKAELPKGVVDLVKRSRKLELGMLVNDGKITPAVANDLELAFLSDTHIQTCSDMEGKISDNFEQTLDALRKNEQVVNFAGKSGVQTIPKVVTPENPLLKDAERRNKR